MKRFLLLFIFFFPLLALAQELDCKVQVMSQQIQGTNKKIFETLQQSLFEFMNEKKWTSHVYSMDERIECNILINVTEQISTDEFKATIQVQSNRPIFNTTLNSPMLNYMDNDFQFKYIEYQPIEFNETSSNPNLVSVLAFYAYVIIGLDYDSFSLYGGTEYIQKAEAIVNNMQSVSERGWKQFESTRNRFWITQNLTDQKFKPIRECWYKYHRLGLDVMSEKTADGRAVIAESFNLLQGVHREKPGSFLMQMFFNAKSDEIVNIFSESYPDEKARVVNVLKEVDPSNSNKYQKIMETRN
jgi:hypothetical protein